MDKVSGISLSTLADNYFVIHVSGEYDYVYESHRKTEIVTLICELIKEKTEKRPDVIFTDRYCSLQSLEFINCSIKYTAKGNKPRLIQFQKDESCLNAKFKKSGNTMNVMVASGLSKGNCISHSVPTLLDSGRKKMSHAKPPTHRLNQINRTGVGKKGI